MNDPASPILETVDLVAGYAGRPALEGISVAIARGAQVAIVGPNGAGKSTLFKVLVGLIPASAGRVMINGEPARQQLRRVAYVPQREEVDWLFPVTVLDVVLMGRYGRLGWIRRPGQHDRDIARHCLDQLGMDALANRPIGQLSGGQQQRIFLARALTQEPDILLLDEPFAGVDAPTQETVLALLASFKSRGITMLVSTHDLPLATSRFELLMLLNRRLVAFGPPSTALNPDTLSATFGSQLLLYQDGERYFTVADHCCPPPVQADAGRWGGEGSR